MSTRRDEKGRRARDGTNPERLCLLDELLLGLWRSVSKELLDFAVEMVVLVLGEDLLIHDGQLLAGRAERKEGKEGEKVSSSSSALSSS